MSEYAVEYAKSGRAGCKLCKSAIGMGSMRLANYVQSPFFDGKMPQWFHASCFYKKFSKILSSIDTSSIKGFESIRWDDQQSIKKKLGIETSDEAGNTSKNSDKENKDDSFAEIDNFSIEYSKSNRSKCQNCNAKIEKEKIRINFKAEGWYHLDCFAKCMKDIGFNSEPDEINGFDDLSEDDKKNVTNSIGSKKTASKRKAPKEDNDDDETETKKSKEISKEHQMRIQSDEFWKLKDTISNELDNNLIKELIEFNNQKLFKAGRDDSVNFLAEIMYFGPMEPCPECKEGQLIFRGKCYYCTGNISAWTKCSYRTQEPKRFAFNVEKELQEEVPFLKKFKFQSHTRIFLKTLDEFDAEKFNPVARSTEKKPLLKLTFTTIGSKLNLKNTDIKKIIEKFGGNLISSLSKTTVACISNDVEVEKMNKKMREAQACEVHVVSEAFIEELDKLDAKDIKVEELILKHNIASWGSDLKTRIENCIKTHESAEKTLTTADERRFISNADGNNKVKLKIKGGAIVDPESNLDEEAHVLCDSKTNKPYSAVLSMVDITRGTNSYYRLQIIEHDTRKNLFYLFRAWGRTGTTIGGTKLTNYSKKEDAINDFLFQYQDKTGNDWHEPFEKKPHKFYPVEMDYGDEDETSSKAKSITDKDYISTSKLAKSIQDLIKLIFDIETMKRQMLEFEIDLNKMPLGKISSNQIKLAFSVLTELNGLIGKSENKTLFIDASNRFYTLIPHDFGLKNPPILNSPELIKEKIDMLNNLLEIEIAYNLLKTDSSSEAEQDPIDAHYNKLKCHMEVVDKASDEFDLILKYVNNTHAATHNMYKLVVEDVFKVCRDSEDKKFTKDLHNRQLLWHGSRLTNFAGILSQGLRIAPPEAPSTGYMFGKGVYFADMVSKSANYCFTSTANPTGLLLLCEVALGDMYERTSAEYVTKLPTGKHSTKGMGCTAPDPNDYILNPDGLKIPLGKGAASGVRNSALLYNEYIVYDTNQIRMKYLIKTKFKYSY